MIYIANKRRKLERIQKKYPNAIILDITSSSPYHYGQILSPFFPHGNIPIPFSDGETGDSVEGIWQGLKVFEGCGVDESAFHNSSMKKIKRTVRKYGKPLGHQKGLCSHELLSYGEARKLIYIPTYKWVLENVPEVKEILKRIADRAKENDIVFLDYNTNEDWQNLKSPLSHASLLKLYIEGAYPDISVESKPKVIQLSLFENL